MATEASTPAPVPRRGWGWAVLSAVLITIGALLAPVAVVANWTQIELSSTDDFVATFAPLASDPEVQDFLADRTSTAIIKAVDLQGRTDELFAGLADSGLSPRLLAALGLLKGTAVESAEGLIQSTTAKFIASPAFTKTFTSALRVTHSQLLAALRADGTGAVSVTEGQIGIELGPIVAQVKRLLVDRGMAFAENIPTVDRTIVIVKSEQLARAQHLYSIIVVIGRWLPLIDLVILALGVLAARRRRFALLGASAAVALLMAALVIAIDLGRSFVVGNLLDGLVPVPVSDVVYAQITAYTRGTAVSVGVVALVVWLVAWLTAPQGLPRRMRSGVSRAFRRPSRGETAA